jgi:hypothetical protein
MACQQLNRSGITSGLVKELLTQFIQNDPPSFCPCFCRSFTASVKTTAKENGRGEFAYPLAKAVLEDVNAKGIFRDVGR